MKSSKRHYVYFEGLGEDWLMPTELPTLNKVLTYLPTILVYDVIFWYGGASTCSLL